MLEPGDAEGIGREIGLLSIVAPAYNEIDSVGEFYNRVCSALEGLPIELLLVDDGSTDGTGAALDALAEKDKRVRVLQLSRNFGHQTALTAGLDHAAGDVVVMMDSDLQDPPEVIPAMIVAWKEGFDVVYGVRRERPGESAFKLRTARWFYRAFLRLTDIRLEPNSGDFRLLDRQALDSLLAMRERSRFLRGMTVWVGFDQAPVEYEREVRAAGETKYTLRRMMRFAIDALSSFSQVPLQVATLLGFGFSALALIGIPLTILARVTEVFAPGIPTTIVVVLLLGGVQLITLGILGEYLGRIYEEVKGRPLYVVRNARNLGAVQRTERPTGSLGSGGSVQDSSVR